MLNNDNDGGLDAPNPITQSLLRFRSLTLSLGDGNVGLIHEKLPVETIRKRKSMFSHSNVDVLVSTIDANTGKQNVPQLDDVNSDVVIVENVENFLRPDSSGLASLQLILNNCGVEQVVLLMNDDSESNRQRLAPLIDENNNNSIEQLALIDDEHFQRQRLAPPDTKISKNDKDAITRTAIFCDEKDNADGANWLTLNRLGGARWNNHFPAMPYVDRRPKKKGRRKVTVIMVEGVEEGEGEEDENESTEEDDSDIADGIALGAAAPPAPVPAPKATKKKTSKVAPKKLPPKRSRLISDEEASKLSGRVRQDTRLNNKSFGPNDGVIGKPITINLQRPDLVSKNNKKVMYLLLDTETTGFASADDTNPDRIIQIAANVFSSFGSEDDVDENENDSFSSYISSDAAAGGGTEAITGISSNFLARGGIDPATGVRHEGGAPSIEIAFEAFLDWLREARIDRAFRDDKNQWQLPNVVLLAHNARFDLGFLNAELKRLRGNDATFASECDLTSYIDTLKLLREKSLWSRPRKSMIGAAYAEEGERLNLPPPPPPSYSQTAIYNHLFAGEGMQGSHNAMGDVRSEQ